jgi:myosin heavy chain 9/10/11/14
LEKSRVTHRNAKERNFHIFYQFLAGASKELRQMLLIEGGPESFAYTKNSNIVVEGIDDKADYDALTVQKQTISRHFMCM